MNPMTKRQVLIVLKLSANHVPNKDSSSSYGILCIFILFSLYLRCSGGSQSCVSSLKVHPVGDTFCPSFLMRTSPSQRILLFLWVLSLCRITGSEYSYVLFCLLWALYNQSSLFLFFLRFLPPYHTRLTTHVIRATMASKNPNANSRYITSKVIPAVIPSTIALLNVSVVCVMKNIALSPFLCLTVSVG